MEIVSDKTAVVYDRIFSRHGTGPAHAMMVGNSLASDIVPALRAGAWGIHVPSDYQWALDAHDEPIDNPKFRLIRDLSALLPIVDEIG